MSYNAMHRIHVFMSSLKPCTMRDLGIIFILSSFFLSFLLLFIYLFIYLFFYFFIYLFFYLFNYLVGCLLLLFF
jgi:hypothetical protein